MSRNLCIIAKKTFTESHYSSTYLHPSQVWSECNVGLLHVRGPRGEQVLTEVLVKVTSVGHECRGQHYVTTDGTHLTLECLTAGLPSLLLISQAGQESLATLNLYMCQGE